MTRKPDCPREMTNEYLAHLCKLASVSAYVFTQPREDWIEWIRDADRSELADTFSCLKIMSEAFLALLEKHPDLRPTFRVAANAEPIP